MAGRSLKRQKNIYQCSKNKTNLVNRPQSRHKTPPNQVLTRKEEFFAPRDRGEEIIDEDWMETEDKREGKRNKGSERKGQVRGI